MNNFWKYFYITTGFFITCYIIYVRLFLTRVPKELLFEEHFNTKIFFVIFSIIICLSIIINNLLFILNLKRTNNTLSHILSFISTFIENSLKEFYTSIMFSYDKIFNNRSELFSKSGKIFYNFWHIYPEYYLLFITFTIRLIILTIFLYEVFIVFKLNYFYKSLILLCVILIIRLLLYILRDFADLADTYREALIIKHVGIDSETQLPITNYSLQKGYEKSDLEIVIKEFIICNKLSGYLDTYDKYKKFFNPRINIIIYTLYFISWCYILYWNLLPGL